MFNYDVGYKKPPRHSQFKPGNRCNPKGRGKRKVETETEILKRVLNFPAEFRHRGKSKRAFPAIPWRQSCNTMASKALTRRDTPCSTISISLAKKSSINSTIGLGVCFRTRFGLPHCPFRHCVRLGGRQ